MKRIQELGLKMKFYRRRTIGAYKYEMMKKDGCCIFLSGNRCTIYENRPLICRFYPFTMFEADCYMFDLDRACEGVGIGESVDERCLNELIQEAERTIGEPR